MSHVFRITGIATDDNKLHLVTHSGEVKYSDIDLHKYLSSSFSTGTPVDAAVTVRLGKSYKKYQILFSGNQ